MYSTYAERKVAAFFQDRIGPNRAGPWGILQPLADGGKMFLKEEIIPTNASGFLFIAGPSLAILTACIGSAVIPWGQTITIGSHTFDLQVADINVGILYIFGVVSLGVYGVMIGGWASNNKYSLLGAIRAASQNISYEISMGLSIIALLMCYRNIELEANCRASNMAGIGMCFINQSDLYCLSSAPLRKLTVRRLIYLSAKQNWLEDIILSIHQ